MWDTLGDTVFIIDTIIVTLREIINLSHLLILLLIDPKQKHKKTIILDNAK